VEDLRLSSYSLSVVHINGIRLNLIQLLKFLYFVLCISPLSLHLITFFVLG
jgi:hypothetical protein